MSHTDIKIRNIFLLLVGLVLVMNTVSAIGVLESTTFSQEGSDAGQTGTRGFSYNISTWIGQIIVNVTKVVGTTCNMASLVDNSTGLWVANNSYSSNSNLTATFNYQTLGARRYHIVAWNTVGTCTFSWDNSFSYPVAGIYGNFTNSLNNFQTAVNNGWVFANIGVDTSTLSVTLINPTNGSSFSNPLLNTFNATASSGSAIVSATNSTLFLYFLNGTVIGTNFTSNVTNNKSNFSMPNLPDGSYKYMINFGSTGGSTVYPGANFTFFVDSLSPTVALTSFANSSYIYSFNSTYAQLNINISAVDETAIDKIWYNSTWNSSLTYVNNNAINRVNLTNVFGRQTIYIYANDTAGNVATNITALSIVKTSYTTVTQPGNLESFILNISLLGSDTLSSSSVIYNGTVHGATNVVDLAGNYIATSQFFIPVAPLSTVYSFYWSMDVGNIFNSSVYNQTVQVLAIDNCTIFTRNILNITMFDEGLQTLIPASQNISIETALNLYTSDRSTLVLNSSGRFTSNPLRICVNQTLTSTSNYSVDIIIKYTADDYAIEYYNIERLSLTNTTETQVIKLYDLLLDDSTEFLLTFNDASYIPAEGVLVYLDRQYISNNTFLTVELPITDSNGQTILHMVRNNIRYNLRMVKDGVLIGNFQNLIAFCNDYAIGDCKINLNSADSVISVFSYYEDLGIYFNPPVYNSTSRTISFSFSSVDGTSKNVLLNVSRNTITGNKTACSASIFSASGTLQCALSSNIDNSSLTVSVYVDDELVTVGSLNIKGSSFGEIGYLGYLIFLVSCIIIFSEHSKNGVLIGIGVGIAGGVTLGLSSGTVIGRGAGVVLIAVVLIIGLWKVNKERLP